MKNSEQQLRHQAVLFSRYLIGSVPDKIIQDRYVKAITHAPVQLDTGDKRLIGFATRHAWSVGFIEAGMALTMPQGELRRRLYILLAILEASPDYTDSFLPQKRGPFYLFKITYVSIRAVIRALIGVLLVRSIRA